MRKFFVFSALWMACCLAMGQVQPLSDSSIWQLSSHVGEHVIVRNYNDTIEMICGRKYAGGIRLDGGEPIYATSYGNFYKLLSNDFGDYIEQIAVQNEGAMRCIVTE